jgi:hypothetical protein
LRDDDLRRWVAVWWSNRGWRPRGPPITAVSVPRGRARTVAPRRAIVRESGWRDEQVGIAADKRTRAGTAGPAATSRLWESDYGRRQGEYGRGSEYGTAIREELGAVREDVDYGGRAPDGGRRDKNIVKGG